MSRFKKIFYRKPHSASQLELEIQHPKQKDRNHHIGGRSFYFFDFDDNVIHLPTHLYVFHKTTGQEHALTTHEFSDIQTKLGKEGIWKDYELRFDDQTGSFRRFREKKISPWQYWWKVQPLEEDMRAVLKRPFEEWRGPSWNFFWYAVHNKRPISIITARGHHPDTLKKGISLLKKWGFITHKPNFLSVWPVSHKPTRLLLGDKDLNLHASELKKIAIKSSVSEAFKNYGVNPGHRFGMSDDDPVNLKLIVEAMRDLKKIYPDNSFFVIDTQGGKLIKQEIFVDHVIESSLQTKKQLSFFDE
ncbi:MAG: hypothetical protein IPM57_12395 [Oligoflexia bacterium]|nr:hypothetical protein [Oligoflexia bacterium]